MNLQTQVKIPKSEFDISHHSKIVLMGSCFSENIGSKLKGSKFQVMVNPFGILYNPISIYNAHDRLLAKKSFTEKDFIHYHNHYHSLMHHGSFSKSDLSEAVEHINKEFNLAATQLENADVLLITFGTSYVFRWNESQEVVGNCHKIPADKFTRERLSIEDICSAWKVLINKIIGQNPTIKVIFTVSPIRHFKDGAHENQLSKAILHLSIDKLMTEFPENTFYFPAYEILLDQLRDYRFYTDDMLHPSNLALNFIWNKFSETYFTNDTQKLIAEWQKISQALSHRPYDSHSKEYLEFLNRTIDNLQTFQERYPYLPCLQEKQHLTQLLKNTQKE